jgi:hypothetical protein
LYVTNFDNIGTNNVLVISGQTNTVIGNPIPVGKTPVAIAFDSTNGDMYVANGDDNTVSVIHTISQQPPDTTITSAVDDNGITLANGSSTLSTSIQISFTGKAGTNPVAGFECSIDNSAFSSCSSPATLTNLAVGKHHFQVRAVDTSGNRDPTPASFSWIIATLTPPTKTTITSAVDGNNAPVQNGGTTTSSSIRFTFTATAGTNPIAGFQCSLDNSPFSSCSSPAALNNLVAGPHKFVVVAVDTAGNKDPNPATFGWTVGTVTPTQSIQQLIQLKHSMHLDPVTDQILDIRLNIALQFAQNNVKTGTCIQLTVFIKQVQGEVGHVTSTQASQLIQAAQQIQMALGCTVPSSGNGIRALSASTSLSSLNQTRNQQQPQTTASSPSLLQRQSQSPYPYSNQYRYPPQYPYLSQIPQSQSPVANAGVSQTVNENTKVTLDGRASYSSTGGVVVGYQWTQLATTGVPVILTGANTATPTLTTPLVPSDTVLAFSLRVLDNHGEVSINPAVVYVTVKHNPNNIGAIGGNTPRTSVIPPQQPQPIIPSNNAISPHSQQQSPIITIPGQQTVK